LPAVRLASIVVARPIALNIPVPMQKLGTRFTLLVAIVLAPTPLVAADDEQAGRDVIFADFEGDDYGGWQASGAAFGTAPAHGTLPGQMPVSGFLGKGLVNSFLGGDGPTGKLTSPEFKIERKYIRFLIGGGGYEHQTCTNLLVDGKVVRSATGPNTQPGGSEQLEPTAWNVGDLLGQTARLEIVDDASGGWGHINVDQIVFTDERPAAIVKRAARELVVERRFLLIPVRNGATKRTMTVSVGGKIERWFDIELADADADWFAPLDIAAWAGKTIAIEVDKLPEDSRALTQLRQSDEAAEASELYHEALRPQLHFSPRRGWNNDPNGLVFYQGRYHLFFQHNPYGWSWGNMHWGHAAGNDLIHWEELGEALYPDRFGPMFSGSAVVDWHNSSGLGRDDQPPLVLFYTAAGQPTVQCLAYSNDGGKTFTKFASNPIVNEITPGNRDPKLLWHEPSRRWVMALYVELDKQHTIHFLTSPDLKQWTVASHIEGFFECPDLFELPLDGDAGQKKWVLTGASSEYQVGSFDGDRFLPETPKLPGHRGRGFYAAQTFSDIPADDDRRIQIGWLQAASPGMPFNQCMSLPLALSLATTADGPRLTWSPVAEFDQLRAKEHHCSDWALESGVSRSIDGVQSELLDINVEIEPLDASEVVLDVRGVPIVYDAAKQELSVNGHHVPAPLRAGKITLRIVVDRTAFEVFASDGLTYIPMPVIPAADNRNLAIVAKGGDARIPTCSVYELRSIWPAAP
jgi:fructan beta-fructosidase